MSAKTFKLIPETEYNALNQKLDLILQSLNSSEENLSNGIGKWITEKQAQEITGKKATTLWKMRNKGLLVFTKINNKVFYDKESILSLLERNKQDAFRRK